MLVVDATVAVDASLRDDGFGGLPDRALVAPPLLWPEARSVLHRMVHRGAIDRPDGLRALDRLETSPVRARSPRGLGREAWRLADELGWGRTYDAEYLALARLLGCRLLTGDGRLRRGTARLGFVVGADEI